MNTKSFNRKRTAFKAVLFFRLMRVTSNVHLRDLLHVPSQNDVVLELPPLSRSANVA